MKKETIRRLAKNFLSLGSAEIISSFLYLLLFVYLARTLGVVGFGKYEFAFAFYLYFSIFASFGLNKIGAREIARIKISHLEHTKKYTNNLISLRFITSIIGFLVLSVIAFIIPKSYDVKMLIFLNGLVMLVSFLSLEWFFIGIEKMEFIGIGKILTAAVFLLLTLLFVKNINGLLIVPIIRTTAVALCIAYLLFVYIKKWGGLKFEFDPTVWKNLAKNSIPILMSVIFVQLYYRFDMLMLGFIKNEREVGLYASAYKIIFFLMVLRTVGINTIFPSLSRHFVESKEKLSELITLSQKAAIIFVIPIGIGGTILAPKLINFLYGPLYAEGTIALQILIWSFVIMGINFTFPQLQIACNRQNVYLKFSSFCILLNIILNFILIPRYGLIGAALATVATEVMSFILFYKASLHLIHVDLIKLIKKPLTMSILMGIFIFFLKFLNLFLVITIGFIAYFALLLFFKHIKKAELLYLKNSLLNQ